MVKIKFGPSGLGPVKDAISRLEEYHTSGLEACELAFVRQIYIKKDDAVIIGEKAKDLGIYLSVHAQYYVNLILSNNSGLYFCNSSNRIFCNKYSTSFNY